MNKELVKEFEYLLSEVKREGLDRLLTFIRKSDFYSAPSSTKYHGSHEGGLLEHSLNVYNRLYEKMTTDKFWISIAEKHKYTKENYIISALLHDLCKTYFYTVEMRNKKIEGKWEQVPTYIVEDNVPYGHGEKSVMMIEEYIKLKPIERYSIRWHMGAYEGQQAWNTLGTAIERYPLILAIHEADMEASKFMEV